MPVPYIDELIQLHQQGVKHAQIAARLNEAGIRTSTGKMWTTKNVSKHVRLAGYAVPARRMTDADRDRAATLLSEGMPANWIAEDLDRAQDSIQRFNRRELHYPAAPDWKATWQFIRKDPEILKLHREIAP